MPDPKPAKSFHFVTFESTTKAPGRKTVEKRARAHAARVTHQRRKDERGQKVVKWVHEGIIPSPLSRVSQVSQAKVDPFASNPHTVLPNQLQSILDWAYECVHPKVLSACSENEGSMIKISWRRVGQEMPLMFHLQVAAAVNLHRAEANHEELPQEVDLVAQKHHERGLSLVRKELNKLKGRPSDALIMAQIMVALLTNPDQSQALETFRESPLARAQNLHRYARLAIVPSLIGALLLLVNKRGGFESVRDFGNSQLLQLADLMISSRLGMLPSFPWLVPSTSILQGPRYHPDHFALVKSRIIGTGLKQLESVDVNLASILRTAGEITVALDHYQECRPNAPRLTDLVNAANETHHKLLSIGADLPTYPSKLDLLRDMCRLAGLIYSDMVLFPLPPTTGVRPRLAGQLRSVMDQFEKFQAVPTAYGYGSDESTDHSLLMMWVLILGGLASAHSPDKPYFVQKLREYVEQIPYVSDWRAFSELMNTYLWWDYIMEEPASSLWTEVVPLPILHHRSSGDSLHQRSSPTSLPIHSQQRNTTTELGTYGLPTPGSSEQSPQPGPIYEWEPVWTLPRDSYLVNWVWT